MKLVIAEKPSVAQAIAHVLGATARKDGYTEGGGWLVSWCVGHLVGLAPADAYDPRYSKWAYDDLPIVPECWQFAADRDKEKQLAVLRALMGREDVDAVVCATDAGREGTCPRCGGRVVEGKKGFTCENRDCGFALWKENRFFKAKKKELTAKIAAALLKEGRAALPGCHSEKTGKTYDAIVILDDTGGKFVGFKLDFPAGK